MKTVRLVRFIPAESAIIRYWEEEGFRSNDTLSVPSLTEGQQGVVSAAIAWALSQLPPGFAVLESVDLRRVPDVVTEWSEGEEPVPLATSPAFVASIVGNGEKGQSAVEINSVPGPETTALAGLWDELSV